MLTSNDIFVIMYGFTFYDNICPKNSKMKYHFFSGKKFFITTESFALTHSSIHLPTIAIYFIYLGSVCVNDTYTLCNWAVLGGIICLMRSGMFLVLSSG